MAEFFFGIRYVLLCRHAPHRTHQLTKDDSGRYPTQIVAERLREELSVSPPVGSDLPAIRLGGIFHPKSPEAMQTVALLGQGIGTLRPPSPETSAQSMPELTGRVEMPERVPEVERGKRRIVPVHADHRLEPWHAASNPEADEEIARYLLEQSSPDPAAENGGHAGRNAVMVVGHMPQLGRLADELARHRSCPARRRRRLQLPLAQAEVACLLIGRFRFPGCEGGTRPGASLTLGQRLSGRVVRRLPTRLRYRSPRVVWTIAPSEKAALADIRDKIKSKLNTATALGGLITVIVSALLAVLFDEKKWEALARSGVGWLSGQTAVQIASGLLLAAIALYLATVYAYDRLLMPPRFWGEARAARTPRGRWLVRRPPSSSAWVLYQNMQRVWWALFTPATLCVGAALSVMAVAFARATGWALGALGGGALAVGLVIWWFRPLLGSED